MSVTAVVRIFSALVALLKLLAGVRAKVDERTAEMERAEAEAMDHEELEKETSRWTKP